MIPVTNGAQPPPDTGRCEACVHDFHEACSGYRTIDGQQAQCQCPHRLMPNLDDLPDLEFTEQERAELAQLAADQPSQVVAPPPRWSPARLAVAFYAIAAAGAVIGQMWVALDRIPWDPTMPMLWRVGMVLPFAACLELLAMALAAMADERMRLGERAIGFRAFSAAVAVLAVGILVVGHAPHWYQVAAFGTLSTSAYALWLLHSAARRRDALRAAGMLPEPPPVYGLHCWLPIIGRPGWRTTRLARQLARERGLNRVESLQAAEAVIRAERRRPAVRAAIERVVRHAEDPAQAQLTVATLDVDRLAVQLAADQAAYDAWAARLAPMLAPPPDPEPEGSQHPEPAPGTGARNTRNSGARNSTSRSPEPAAPDKASAIKRLAARNPELSKAEIARRIGVSDRYVRDVLNSPNG